MNAEIIKKVKDLLVQGQLEYAIEELMKWSEDSADEKFQNALVLLQMKYNDIKEKKMLGLIRYEDALREQLQVSNALLDMISTQEKSARSLGQRPTSARIQNNTILFLASNPADTALLQLEKEFVQISRNLQDSEDDFRLVSEWAVTPYHLQKSILKHKPRILHFSGHGSGQDAGERTQGRNAGFSRNIDEGGILLEDGKGGYKTVSASALKDLFSILTRHFTIELVVLNACYSKRQAEAISICVPYVVGMSSAIEDQASIEFSTGLYMGLAAENDIELAFDLAKNKILLEGLENFKTPVLIKNTTL